MNPAEVAERGAELVEKISAELGEDWTKREGIAGTEKSIVVWDDDQVALAAGPDVAFYVIGGELWSRIRKDDSIVTGCYRGDEFVVTAVTDAPDATRN